MVTDMRTVEYLVNSLIDYGVSDVFGIPGGVVIDLLYEMNNKKHKIYPHLSYHEQAAAFEAAGYAQVHGTIGVVYVTRGPGLTNTITAVVDAYSESTPLVVITGHANERLDNSTRFPADQELDTKSMFSKITKYVARIDTIDNFEIEVNKALDIAMEGRKGPVLIDVLASLWNKEVHFNIEKKEFIVKSKEIIEKDIDYVIRELKKAKRPVILAGDGIRQSNTIQYLNQFSTQNRIPVLSSRCGADSASSTKYYYGYIGSHGVRYSNAILSKSDVIISLGNRLSFPTKSKSYKSIYENAKIIQIDIDNQELNRVDVSESICADLTEFMPQLAKEIYKNDMAEQWIATCDKIKESLRFCDLNEVTIKLASVISNLSKDNVIVNDVGNNEFWASRAYIESNKGQRTMFSKSFGALGCAIPKAIGAYYKIQKPVFCITGDQGFQINSQELNFISQNKVEICIVVVNNQASGMIRDREKIKGYTELVHTTAESGYYSVNLLEIASAFDINYYKIESKNYDFNKIIQYPCIIEIEEAEEELIPGLPKGNHIYDMIPKLPNDIMDNINKL